VAEKYSELYTTVNDFANFPFAEKQGEILAKNPGQTPLGLKLV